MITVVAYLDGETSGCGYKFVVQQDCTAWTAYRTNRGFKRFLELTGLEIDPSKTKYWDCTAVGHGRRVFMQCNPRKVNDHKSFWNRSDVPEGARKFIGLSNGQYVDCYVVSNAEEATIYRPNPNAKEVYKPYDYRAAAEICS